MRNLCTVDDCTAIVLANGLCKTHYHRMRRKGNTSDERKNPRQRCTVDGCDGWRVGFGLCALHYGREWKEKRRQSNLAARAGQDRRCAWCEQPIPVERKGQAIYCRLECKRHALNERNRQRPENAAKLRVYHYERKFGITVEDYDRMLGEQDGRCAICGTDSPGGRGIFHVDHCHDSAKVRGLLCTNCNSGLGQFKDDPARLRAAIDYLAR